MQVANGRFGGETGKEGSRTAPTLTGQEIRGSVGGAISVYRRSHGEASCSSGDSGAPSTVMGQSQLRNGESGTWRFAGAMGQRWLRSGESGTRTWGASKDGSVSRSVPVFVLRWRPGRSLGPGRLTTKVGACDHAGQDAKPTPHRLPLLWGVRRRSPLRRSPAIGRWILSVGASHPVPSAFDGFPGQGVVHDGPGVRRPV